MKPTLRIALLALLLVSLACSTAGLPFFPPEATPTRTPQPLPPAIVETVPPIGTELGLQATLLVYFSEPMDKASVEAALGSDFSAGFLLNWVDETTLGLTPKAAFPSDGRVNFTLAASAKSAAGLALPEPLAFSYKTAGPLRASQFLPAPQAVDISPDSAVVVSFNQPVVALGADNPPAGLTLEPPAQGAGEWLNTSTYIFRPDPALAGGVDYTARVNPQLVATSGAALEAGTGNSWAFRTSLPRLLGISAGPDAFLLLDPELALTFNQPMDRASVESGFAFSGPSGKMAGSFTWNEKSTVATFKPSDLLERETSYTVALSGQARSHGGAPLGSDTSKIYQTFPAFGISGTLFTNGAVRPRDEGVGVTFTAPLAEYSNNELEALVIVSPKISYGGTYFDGPQTIVTSGVYTPGERYTVTFPADLKDRWGQALGQEFTFTFREPDADPALNYGSYWPMLFTRPDSPLIDVQAVNVSQLRVLLGSFTLDEFFRYQADYDYRLSYVPREIDSWNERLALALNQNEPYTVDLSRGGRGPSLVPGLYLLDVSSREITNNTQTGVPLLVSNVNLTVKSSGNEIFVWAVDLRTQAPVANTLVTLYDDQGTRLATGLTDANGIWKGVFPREPVNYSNLHAMLAQPGEDLFGMAAEGWNYEIAPWNFGLSTGNGAPQPHLYLYTERPVYRPGDTVHYRGILNTAHNGRYTNAGIGSLSIALIGMNNDMSQEAPVSAYGSFHGEFTLSPNTPPGYYILQVNSDKFGDDFIEGGNISFTVADYRKPEINLSVTLSPEQVVSGQTLTGTVNAAYFFGAPVNDLPFDWSLSGAPSHFDLSEYSTGLYQSSWYSRETTAPGKTRLFGQIIAQGKGRTGADGSFSIPLDDIQVDETSQLTLEITASESGGFPVSARTTATVHPADFYVGVRPGSWFGRARTATTFDLLTTGLDKQPLPNKALTASFNKVDWQRTEMLYGYDFAPIYTLLESKPLTTGTDGKASVAFTPEQAGTYMLEVVGGDAKTQVLLWVGGAQNATWPNLPYQRMELTADKENYKPGETASVFIPNPFSTPALALITTERSSVLTSQVVSVLPEGYTLSLPLTDEQAPNTYVAVTMLGPNTDFRQGYVNLPVEPSAFTLNVDLKTTPEKARPGETLTLDLTVTDAKGQPAQAEFSMAVVDLAALALAAPNSQEIVPAYYSIQPLGVNTGLTSAIYARRARFQPLGGGGGGGGGPEVILREKFPDTAYWKADIVTDAQGKAQLTLTLPDNLTTWQVEARGLTQDVKVGQAQVRVVTGKELMIRPQTPRFLVVGDHAELAAFVNNTTASALEATVNLQVTGFSLDDPATAEQKVQVPANGRVRVAWSGQVQAGDAVDAIFAVSAQGLQDASRPVDGAIPVLRYTAPQTFSTAGVLPDAASRLEILALPRTFQPLGGKLDVELAPSLAAVILAEIQAGEGAPEEINWNNERLASDLVTKLSTYLALKDAGLSTAPLLDSVLDDTRRLLANQSYVDNGWSWAVNLNKPSDPYVTAYVLFALNQVSKAGVGIDVKDALQRGYDYLVATPPFGAQEQISQPWAMNRAIFHYYVLRQVGSFDPGYTIDMIYSNLGVLEPWAKALLAEKLLLTSGNEECAINLLSDLQGTAIRSASGAHWESSREAIGDGRNPNSPLFNTAVVVFVQTKCDPSSPILADAVRYLVSQRGASGRWGSSYERAWIILALNEYMRATGELRGSFNFSAALNGAPLAKGEAGAGQNLESVTASTPLVQLHSSGANSLLVSRDAGDGKLYYRAALTVDRPVESAPALSQGISVSRAFLSCSGDDCQPVTSYQMPDDSSGRVKVQLTVTLPNDAYYLMVQDHIPAGAEMLDTTLKTSQQGEESVSVEAQYDNADPFSGGWGWWYFNNPQLYNDHILWSADYLPAGTYVLTYTIVPSLPGQYRVLPAHAWQAYFPEVQGTSAGAVFEIR